MVSENPQRDTVMVTKIPKGHYVIIKNLDASYVFQKSIIMFKIYLSKILVN